MKHRIDMRFEQVRRILDAAVGDAMPYHDGLGRFWNLDRDALVTATVYGERVVVPGRPEDSALVKALRGLPPFDGTLYLRMPPGGEVRDEDIKFIENWIRDGAQDSTLKPRASIAEKVRSIEPIEDLDGLRRHLQLAIEIEHATMPPYLTALYSLCLDGANLDTYSLIKQVVVEEMLHLALACNLLNAVGGTPNLDYEGFIPDYPVRLPQSDKDYLVHLERCSDAALDTFLKIELPSYPLPARAAADVGYRTIGEFYLNLRDGLTRLCDDLGPGAVFTGDSGRQLTTGYRGRGELFAIGDLTVATQALDIIIDQGEGTQAPEPKGPSKQKPHYFLFRDIRDRTIHDADGRPLPREEQFNPDEVRRTVKDPRQAGEGVRELSRSFDEAYSELLRVLNRVFNGYPTDIGRAVGMMRGLRQLATELMDRPVGCGQTASPTFYYYSARKPGSQRG